MIPIDDHMRGIVVQGTVVDGAIVIEVKCLYHSDKLLTVINTSTANAWWPIIDTIVREHLAEKWT